jgi:hypothetical protein
MTRLYIPTAVAVVLIAALTWQEAKYSDRFNDSSITAAQFGQRFVNVPRVVGPWEGVDQAVSGEVLSVAGAVSHVNRTYVNVNTQEEVDLWLIVGHSRDVCRHTPDICYPSQGFAQIGSALKHVIKLPDGEEATFNTSKFRNESSEGLRARRVYWAWNGNDEEHQVWEAPDYTKLHFGNNRALYKLYFTYTIPPRKDDDINDNPATEFAKLMIPRINAVLFPERAAGDPGAAGEALAPPVAAEPADEQGQ